MLPIYCFRLLPAAGWRSRTALAVLALLMSGLSAPALAQHRPAAPLPGGPATTASALAGALRSDGTLRPGATGAFDASGYQMGTDPATGGPIFRPAGPQGAGDENWQDGFDLPGTNGIVRATVVAPNGDIYIGGSFTAVGSVVANRVARWDGTTWSALGAGVNNTVRALAISGADVYVGGDFNTAGGAPAIRVARWNGATWSALGAGLDNTVYALAVSGADVYAGGDFTTAGGAPASRMARWNGTTWSALGAGFNNTVYALAILGTDVYVGGWFTTAGGAPASRVARWNGTTWSALGAGLNSFVFALAILGTDVYVGGFFTTAGGAPANYVARWNGATWSALGAGVSGDVRALTVAGTDVYVGGNFTQAGGAPASYVARWNGTTWNALGAGVNSNVNALAVSGADVYVGGGFTTAGGTPVNRVARWSGTTWSALGTSLDNTVFAVAVSGADVYVGGNFTTAGGVPANYVARWNGTTWSALGAGVNSTVYALAVSGGAVYAGGFFTQAGGAPANYVARWNGTTWSALGTGANNTVFALAALGPDVYVGGFFTTAGGAPANRVARWNGTTWSALGAGLDNIVYALSVSGAAVYVGGGFTTAGGAPANNVARWDGTTWSALGAGVNGQVRALTVSGADVYVGGNFTQAGGAPASRVARWNGTTWSALGTGVNNIVYAVAGSGADVYVGGNFTTAGGAPVNRVARWNGTTWNPLGTGLDNTVNALAVSGATVYAGGNFTTVGDGSKATAYFGIYAAAAPNAAPTALGLSNNIVDENTGANAVVASLVTTDPDVGDTHTYTLVSGVGSTDNALVNISGNLLRITASPDFETKNSYAIRVRTTDAGGAFFENTFTITIVDQAEPLTVSTVATVPAGLYSSLTITPTGAATLSGAITVDGPLVVQAGGEFDDNCQIISGTGSFALAADATLRICNPAGISVSGATGAVQVSGARTFSPGARYIYGGTIPQTTGTGLSAARELVIANTAGVTLSQATAVASVLRLTAGTLTTASQPLTLLSTATQQAYVLHNGGTTSGAVTVQRYVGPAARGYRHLSAPVQATTVAALTTAGFTAKVNPAYNALPAPALTLAQFPTVFGYDEARGGTNPSFQDFTVGYFSPATLGSALVSGRGYAALTAGGITADFTGSLTTGDVAQALSVTGPSSGTASNKAGWQLLGNPYAQPIDWDNATIPAGLDGAAYVWYATANGGAYRARVAGTGTLTDGLIGLGQGFFVHASAPTTFTFQNAMRVAANVGLGRVASTLPLVRLTLTNAQGQADEVAVVARPGATLGFDAAFDALRPGANVGVPTLSALISGQEAMVSALPAAIAQGTATTVELTATLPTAGQYGLSVAEVANFVGTDVALLDRLTNTRYALTAQPVLALTATRANEVVAGRFALVFNGQRVLGTSDLSLLSSHLTLFPNPAAVGGAVRVTGCPGSLPVAVLDLAGRRVATAVADAAGTAHVSTAKLAAGTYVVRAADGRTTRLVVQ